MGLNGSRNGPSDSKIHIVATSYLMPADAEGTQGYKVEVGDHVFAKDIRGWNDFGKETVGAMKEAANPSSLKGLYLFSRCSNIVQKHPSSHLKRWAHRTRSHSSAECVCFYSLQFILLQGTSTPIRLTILRIPKPE